MNIDELLGQITPEQMEKARACTSVSEITDLAKAEGIELSNEQLDAIAGGQEWWEICDLGKSGY